MKCPPENLSVESQDGFEMDSSEDFELYVDSKEFTEFRVNVRAEALVPVTEVIVEETFTERNHTSNEAEAADVTHPTIPEVIHRLLNISYYL